MMRANEQSGQGVRQAGGASKSLEELSGAAHPERVPRVFTDELLNLGQLGWERWTFVTSATEESKARTVQGLDLGPLLSIASDRCLEGPTHLMQLAPTIWACHGLLSGQELEALVTGEAGVRNQICRSPAGNLGWRGQAVPCREPQCHALELVGGLHARLDEVVEGLRRSCCNSPSQTSGICGLRAIGMLIRVRGCRRRKWSRSGFLARLPFQRWGQPFRHHNRTDSAARRKMSMAPDSCKHEIVEVPMRIQPRSPEFHTDDDGKPFNLDCPIGGQAIYRDRHVWPAQAIRIKKRGTNGRRKPAMNENDLAVVESTAAGQ